MHRSASRGHSTRSSGERTNSPACRGRRATCSMEARWDLSNRVLASDQLGPAFGLCFRQVYCSRSEEPTMLRLHVPVNLTENCVSVSHAPYTAPHLLVRPGCDALHDSSSAYAGWRLPLIVTDAQAARQMHAASVPCRSSAHRGHSHPESPGGAIAGEGEEGNPVEVEGMLTKFLREHQRDGLQFLFDCVTGRKANEFEGLGWCALQLCARVL